MKRSGERGLLLHFAYAVCEGTNVVFPAPFGPAMWMYARSITCAFLLPFRVARHQPVALPVREVRLSAAWAPLSAPVEEHFRRRVARLWLEPNLGQLVVVGLGRRRPRRAETLLWRAKMGSAHAVDSVVVVTALEFGSAVIATGDPDAIASAAATPVTVTTPLWT